MDENAIFFDIRRAAFKVHTTLGPGLLESVYELALAFELRQVGLQVETQVALPVVDGGQQLDGGYRLDLLVERKVIVELKSVEILLPVHHKQLLTYLKLSGLKLGQLYSSRSRVRGLPPPVVERNRCFDAHGGRGQAPHPTSFFANYFATSIINFNVDSLKDHMHRLVNGL